MDQVSRALLSVGGGSAAQTYVDDVFSTWLYTGNGGTQTITNGIDLTGKGGLVWIKRRDGADNNFLFDTVRGNDKVSQTNLTNAESTGNATVFSFSSSGFILTGNSSINLVNGAIYASWTFRKAPKFFDVVTYTGNGTAGRQISHSLGQTPGCIILKQASGASNWWVWHTASPTVSGRKGLLFLNTNDAADTSAGVENYFGNGANTVDPTSTVFTVGGASGQFTNVSGQTYVAYLFAHDTAADGLIQCGSFTTDGSGNATVNFGWEPQWLLLKSTVTADNWYIFDNLRGMPVGTGSQPGRPLFPNLNLAEGNSGAVSPVSNGFSATGAAASEPYIYVAIRRSNKPPTTGTQVFTPVAYTGTGTNNTVTSGIVTDLVIEGNRTSSTAGTKFGVWSRPFGNRYLLTTSDAAQVNAATTVVPANPWDTMTGFKVGTTSTLTNDSTISFVYWMFKRSVGFCDVAFFTGTGASVVVPHNLGAVPQLVIMKNATTAATNWRVSSTLLGSGGTGANTLTLNTTDAAAGTFANTNDWTAASFTVNGASASSVGATYVCYLFASLPGVSLVGTYTGNGTSQTINCGFTTGARFVLVKRTDAAGAWVVFDTARGIVAGNDARILLNDTVLETAAADAIDPDTTGFIANATGAGLQDINISAATYIYLAIA